MSREPFTQPQVISHRPYKRPVWDTKGNLVGYVDRTGHIILVVDVKSTGTFRGMP